jgi:alpha-galactosidase
MSVKGLRILIVIHLIFLANKGVTGVLPIAGSQPGDVNVHQWVEQHFANGKIPPFSFVLDGKNSDDFILNWQYNCERKKSENQQKEEHVYTWSDKESGLAFTCAVTCYIDFNVVEWVLRIKNISGKNSLLIEKVHIVDQQFMKSGKGDFTLHTIKGSKGGKDDYRPSEEPLKNGKTVRLTPVEGRSSDNTAFPFFTVKSPDSSGFVVAIGWTGKWFAEIGTTSETSLSLKAGMEKMKLVLYPEEEIRTPAICLLFRRSTDPMMGTNQFRRFLLAHKIRPNSVSPLSASLSPNSPAPCNGFFGCLSDSFAFAKISRAKQLGIMPEVFWMDAGWYQGGGDNWQITGTWSADKQRFPNSLRPIADVIHKEGSKFLVWFEPERVAEGTMLARDHEDWMLKLPDGKKNIHTGFQDFILNLGNKDALEWLTNYISGFIKEEGIDYYRQDFNIDPMPYWEANDKPDRMGITEIRHIEGLYAFWDTLLARFPNLIIDNCSSGGRRIDLETMSRSLPLWRSDYDMGEPEGLQNHTCGLNFYIPLHGTGNYSSGDYEFRSGMSSSMVLFWDLFSADSSLQQMKKCMEDFKWLRPYYSGDYFPLTGTEKLLCDDTWLAYQLNRPEKRDGVILAFRRKNCPDDSIMVRLVGLEPDAKYELLNKDSGDRVIEKGEKLNSGYKLFLSEKQKSLLIAYKLVTN